MTATQLLPGSSEAVSAVDTSFPTVPPEPSTGDGPASLRTVNIGPLVRARRRAHRGSSAAQVVVSLAVPVPVVLAPVPSTWMPYLLVATLVGVVVALRITRRLRRRNQAAAWAALSCSVLVTITALVTVIDVVNGGPLSRGSRFFQGFYSGLFEPVYLLPDLPPALDWLLIVPLFLGLQTTRLLRRRRMWPWLRSLVLLIAALFLYALLVGTAGAVREAGVPVWVTAVAVIALPAVLLASRTAWRALRGASSPVGAWEFDGPLQRRRLFTGRQPVKVIVLLVLSAVLGILGAVLLRAPVPEDVLATAGDPEATAVRYAYGTYLVGLGALFLAVRAYISARRRAAQRAAELLTDDRRTPLLYLRSFGDDRVRVRAHGANRRAAIERMLGRRSERFERVLVWHLWKFGPVVGVGQPAEQVPRLGAAREYLSDDEWRHHVEAQMQSARLIVVVLGRTEGLRWEIQTMRRLGIDDKAVFVVTPVSRTDRGQRWAAFDEMASQLGWLPTDVPLSDTALVLRLSREDGWRELVGDDLDEFNYEVALEVAAAAAPDGVAESVA